MASKVLIPKKQREFLMKKYPISKCLQSPSTMGSQFLAHILIVLCDLHDLMKDTCGDLNDDE